MKRLKRFILVLMLMSALFTVSAQEYPRGDVDLDGAVSISDVTCLIDNLLKGVSEADVDLDGEVNISDVTCLIDYLLNGSWSDEQVHPSEGDDWVDLGLPSGTLWATKNIGANAPEEYGEYFAWGETEPKDYYHETTYKWFEYGYYDADGNYHQHGFTKYCSDISWGFDGFIDGKTELDPVDDAATANWGAEARMPSFEQSQELVDNCSWQWTKINGVWGRKGTGPNGNSIFFPAAGYRLLENLNYAGRYGYYWSRTITSSQVNAYELYFSSDKVDLNYGGKRIDGYTVRAVRVSHN